MDKHPEIATVPYDSYRARGTDLQNGRIDAVFGDTAVVTNNEGNLNWHAGRR